MPNAELDAIHRQVKVGRGLDQEVLHNVRFFDPRQFAIETLVFVSESRMVDAQLVQQCRMDVVNRNSVFDGVIAEFVCRTVTESGFESASSKPHRESSEMVISPVALGHGCSPEFRSKHDDRVLQQVALFEISDERGDTLIDFLGRPCRMRLHRSMMIPVAMIHLDEANSAFGLSPSQQAVGSKRSVTSLSAIQIENMLRFSTDVHQFGHTGLHAEG